MKALIIRIIVIFLVIAGAVAAIAYFMGDESPFYYAHDAGANVTVWLDTNGNGKQDGDEPFLPNVCVWGGYLSDFQSLGGWQEICQDKYSLTDESGGWSEFYAGGTCDEIYIAAQPPKGYRPTTPLVVNGCNAEFGFAPSDPTSKIPGPDIAQYLQQRNTEVLLRVIEVITGLALVIIAFRFVSKRMMSGKKPERKA